MTVKMLSGITALSGILSIVFVIGSSDIGLINTETLTYQLARQGAVVLCAGGIWAATMYLEKCRKKITLHRK